MTDFLNAIANHSKEDKSSALYDRIIQGGLLVVGILGLIQGQTSWYPYTFILVLLILSFPFMKSRFSNWRTSRIQRKTTELLHPQLRNFVDRATHHVFGSDPYAIPCGINNLFERSGLRPIKPSQTIESVFSTTVHALQDH